jgi:hypothetical protein
LTEKKPFTIRCSTKEDDAQIKRDVLNIIEVFIENNMSRQQVLNALTEILSMMFGRDFPDDTERDILLQAVIESIKNNARSFSKKSGIH